MGFLPSIQNGKYNLAVVGLSNLRYVKKISFLIILLLVVLAVDVSAKWFQQKTIYSNALQQEKTYFVGLPTSYNESDTTTKYPVIIFLHGASVTATEMVNSLEPFLDNFITNFFFDKLFKVIFVIPDGSCEPYRGSFYTNSSLYGNYEDYIVQDLMAEIGSKYKTYHAREKWSIMGHSMGGYGAMKIALKYPENYIGVASLSGPLHVTYFDKILPDILSEHGSNPPYDFNYSGSVTQLVYSMAGAFSPDTSATPPILFPINSSGAIETSVLDLWEAHNPINLIGQWKGNPAMAVFTYCGGKDEFKLAIPNQMFSDSLDRYHLRHTYTFDPSGDHVTSLFTSLPQGINFLYHVMDSAQIRINTRIDDWDAVGKYSVYPNPAIDKLTITGNSETIKKVTFYNLAGLPVMHVNDLKPRGSIDVRAFPKGVYIILIENKNGFLSSARMIKK